MRSGFRWRQGAGDVSHGGSPGKRIAWPRTLAAKRDARLHAGHLRFVHEEPRGGVLHCFLLDCSGSMVTKQRLALAKGLLIALFDRASKTRTDAALICFSGTRADLRFGPAVPRWWNDSWIAPIGGGGGTPFASGLDLSTALLERARRKQPAQQRWLWILTDGRNSGTIARPDADRIVVVDFERKDTIRLDRCRQLALDWSAQYFLPEDLIG